MNQKLTRTMLAVVSLVLMVFVLALPAAAQDAPVAARTITVTGFGQESGAPDVAYLTLGVDATSENPTEAFNQVNEAITTIRDAVLAVGIAPEDIQTTGFNMWVQDSYDPQLGTPTGGRTYRAQNMLSITIREVENTGQVITAAINAGANSINGLSFGIADTSTLAQEARVNAIADARERAEQIAAALGVTLGEPQRVDETIAGGVFPQSMYSMGMGGGGDASISQGQLAVSVQLTITYAIN